MPMARNGLLSFNTVPFGLGEIPRRSACPHAGSAIVVQDFETISEARIIKILFIHDCK